MAGTLVEPMPETAFFLVLKDDFSNNRSIWREVTFDQYHYALGVVPPIMFNGTGFLMGEAASRGPRGFEYYAFARHHDKYYARMIAGVAFPDVLAELHEYLSRTQTTVETRS